MVFSQQGTAMGEQWKRLPPSEREPFLKLAAEDSKRYARDKASLTEAWLAMPQKGQHEITFPRQLYYLIEVRMFIGIQ